MDKLLPGIPVTVVGCAVLVLGGVGVALGLENQDGFCASCHTEPEATYSRQETSQNPATLASFHATKQTACIDRHSSGGILGRAKGLEQGAQDLTAYVSGAYHQPAVTTNPLGDDSCLKCHADVIQRSQRGGERATNGHYHFFLPQWQAVASNAAHCTTCHTAHTRGLDGLQFMLRGKAAQVCDDCHTALSGRVR